MLVPPCLSIRSDVVTCLRRLRKAIPLHSRSRRGRRPHAGTNWFIANANFCNNSCTWCLFELPRCSITRGEKGSSTLAPQAVVITRTHAKLPARVCTNLLWAAKSCDCVSLTVSHSLRAWNVTRSVVLAEVAPWHHFDAHLLVVGCLENL